MTDDNVNVASKMREISLKAQAEKEAEEKAYKEKKRQECVKKVRNKHRSKLLKEIKDRASCGARNLEYQISWKSIGEDIAREEADTLAELLRAEGFACASGVRWIDPEEEDMFIVYVAVSW